MLLLAGALTGVLLVGYYLADATVSGRYLALVLPPVACAAFATLGDAILERSTRLFVILFAAVVLLSMLGAPGIRTHMKLHTIGNERMFAAGERLRTALAEAEQIVAADVGVIAYSSGRAVVDIHGLVSPEFISADVATLLQSKRPRYFVLRAWQLREATKGSSIEYTIHRRFKYPSFRLSDRTGDDYLLGEFTYSP